MLVTSSPANAARLRGPAVRLLDVLPEFEAAVPREDHDLARRALAVPELVVAAGERVPQSPQPGPAIRMLLDGVVLRRTSIGGRAAAEVLGRADVLVEDDAALTLVDMDVEHVAHETTRIAVLDERFRLAARRWPGLHAVVQDQTARQVARGSRSLAILHLPRVEDRLKAVLAELVERWGRVTAEGVVLDLELTHGLLGELVGARRPTVSLALGVLAASGAVVRRDDRCWVLSPSVLG